MKKVLLLALGDDYWTKFVIDMSIEFGKLGIPSIIVVDSRIGEYQCFGKRITYGDSKAYYLSDFIRDSKNAEVSELTQNDIPISSVFSDYYRLLYLGADKKLLSTDWTYVKNITANFFIHVMENEDVGLVIHDQVSTSFSYICWLVAQKRNIPYFGIVGARIPERYEVRRTVYDEDKRIEALYESIANGDCPITTEESGWVDSYLMRIDDMEPSYMKGNFLNHIAMRSYVNTKKLRSFVRKIYYQIVEASEVSNHPFRESPGVNSLRSLVRNLGRYIRSSLVNRFFDELSSDWYKGNTYYVYPIHYQPEASTSIGSPEHVDQINFLTNVAFNIPNGHWLVVKDHVSAYAYPNTSFYKAIKMLPNVKLVAPKTNIKPMLRKARALITLTSTAGFEALLLGKKVYIFGRASYDFHPHCVQIKSWENFSNEVRNGAGEEKIEYDNRAFLLAYRRYTREGSIQYHKYGWGIAADLLQLSSEVLDEQ
jgi:hypothetical protein